MAPTTVKQEIVNFLTNNAVDEISQTLCWTGEDDDEDMVNQTVDTLIEDILHVETCRYGVRFGVPKSREWLATVLPDLDDIRFTQMLRVRRDIFNYICSKIENSPVFHGSNSILQFPVQIQLAVTLFRLGSNGESASIRKIAALFGIGDGGTIDNITKRVFKAILLLREQFLYWPNQVERKELVASSHNELPYCIGYLDGTEIKLAEAPICDRDSYFSRKKNFSIKAQVICDHSLKIRQVVVGYPGSVHDARIFSLCKISTHPENYFSPPEWIAADSAYKLTETVITPYKKNSKQASDDLKQNFNYNFSKYRVRIEHCIGLLKERFSSLKELRLRIHNKASNKLACDWFVVYCIIHNIIITKKRQTKHDTEDLDFEFIDSESDVSDNVETPSANEDHRAEIKRKALYTLMCKHV